MQYSDILSQLKAENRLRTIPEESKTRMIDLLSNDYLGLALRADSYKEEFMDRFGDAPFTSVASRLLSRRQHYHNMLEEFLCRLYGRPALLFNSGYHANVGLIQALATPGTLLVSDRLIHASSIDGIRLSKRDFKRFAHNDILSLKEILSQNADKYDRILILAESIYSMDGDLAPLRELIALKSVYPNVLICLDEAHGFGVRGERGLGLAEELGVIDYVDIIIGTLGKAAASAGAFVISSPEIISMLINTARSFIFSTALPPVNCAWSYLMIEKILGMTCEREHLRELSEYLITAFNRIAPIPTTSRSQIVPYITGSASGALDIAAICQEAGFDCMAIRRPTVPPGGERVRFSLNAGLAKCELEKLIEVMTTDIS